MSFSDLTFGWTSQTLVLASPRLITTFELQEPYKNDDWTIREPPWSWGTDEEQASSFEEFESKENLRYAEGRRVLTAKAMVRAGSYDNLYLGVPDDKQSKYDPDRRLESIAVRIVEEDGLDVSQYAKKGVVNYFKPTEEYGGEAWAQFFMPSSFFDELGKLSTRANATIEIVISAKCWHWLGPIGDHALYVSTEERYHAELATVRMTASIPSESPDTSVDIEMNSDARGPNALNTRFQAVERATKSIQIAIWVLVAVVAYSLYQLLSR